jgi:hypothetical protein
MVLPLYEYPFRTSIARQVVAVFGTSNTKYTVFKKAFSVNKNTNGQVSTSSQHTYIQHQDDSVAGVGRQVYTVGDGSKASSCT